MLCTTTTRFAFTNSTFHTSSSVFEVLHHHQILNSLNENNLDTKSSTHSFKKLLLTPEIKTSSKGRHKSLNSTAQFVVKLLFDQRYVKQKQPPTQLKKNKEES